MTIGELLKIYEENKNVEIWVVNQHGCIWNDTPLTKEDVYKEDSYWENRYILSWEISDEDEDAVLLYITIST